MSLTFVATSWHDFNLLEANKLVYFETKILLAVGEKALQMCHQHFPSGNFIALGQGHGCVENLFLKCPVTSTYILSLIKKVSLECFFFF